MEEYPERLIEPFAGGATVGLTALCEGYVDRLTLVELDCRVAHLWTVVFSGLGEELASRIEELPELNDAYTVRDGPPPAADDDIGLALAALLINRTTWNGNLSGSAGDIGRDGAETPEDFRYTPETLANRIRILSSRRDAVDVIHGDALETLSMHSTSPKTVFYLDPPYSLPGGPAKGLYRHPDVDHHGLITVAGALEGDVLFSHQDHPDVRRLAKAQGFQLAELTLSRRTGARVELLMARELSWLVSAKLRKTKVLTPLPLDGLGAITLSGLPVFIVVAEELHFARAAARLGVHRSAVTRSIQQLEAELATSLVVRSTQSAALTEAGSRLYARCRLPLERINAALRKS